MSHWRNWTGDRRVTPSALERPRSEAELVACVERAAGRGQPVRATGSGHSFSDLVPSDGCIVDLGQMARVLSVDRERARVTVEAGITIGQLVRTLDLLGYALPNLGDIHYQTLAGATQTGTHGTGGRFHGIASQIVGLRLVTADGTVREGSLDDPDPAARELASLARVALGALGIVSAVTLQCVPAFRLRAVEDAERIDGLVDGIDGHVDAHDHFEFFWVPHTGWALTKRNDRTEGPLAPRGAWERLRDDVVFGNLAFGALAKAARRRPDWIPRLARALPNPGRREYVDVSWRVFTSPRWVRFHEMEYAVPREAGMEVLARIRSWVKSSGQQLLFPVEVRFTAADDVPLSPANGRDTCWLAVHVTAGRPYEPYFRAVEGIAREFGGRPHWGKLHFRTAEDLAPAYPEWERFQALRRSLDPEGRFANAHVRRVLGTA